nr:putative ribonuclease H-like domain-containing protein [Tanacetum cinerariifolium]
VFFLATKDETSTILKTFIIGIENQINLKVKIIRSDNRTEFKNQDLNQFCGMKGIKREFSVTKTPQHNRIAERKNRNLIEAARTMLADSLLPIPFWTESVNTACYVQNRMCDKKNNVLFTDTECIVLCSYFKFPDENHVLLRVPRENNMHNVDLKNIILSGDLTCLFAKATLD